MANTVEMQIAEGCKSYDLYVTSEFRRSMFVEGKMKDNKFEAIQLLVKHSEEYKVPDGNKKNKENYYKSIQFR